MAQPSITRDDVLDAFNGVPMSRREFDTLTELVDRLSPPAPEVDEATVWTDRVVAILNARLASDDDRSQEELVIPILRELIASKDAEIAKLTGKRDRQYDENVNRIAAEGAAIVRAEKAESELAALRAENERLRDACGRIAAMNDLSGVPDADLESYARGNLYECETIAREALKAAERNTAEPAKETTVSYDPNYKCPSCGVAIGMLHEPDCALMLSCTAEPAKTHVWPATHDDACSEIKGADTTPGTNAGAVEVTEGDHAFAEAWEINHPPGSAHRIELSKRAAIYRTEAEARGRREALEAATARLEWYRQYGAGMIDQRGFAASLIAELKRMMTGEK